MALVIAEITGLDIAAGLQYADELTCPTAAQSQPGRRHAGHTGCVDGLVPIKPETYWRSCSSRTWP